MWHGLTHLLTRGLIPSRTHAHSLGTLKAVNAIAFKSTENRDVSEDVLSSSVPEGGLTATCLAVPDSKR